MIEPSVLAQDVVVCKVGDCQYLDTITPAFSLVE
jgi:hypothetical protein